MEDDQGRGKRERREGKRREKRREGGKHEQRSRLWHTEGRPGKPPVLAGGRGEVRGREIYAFR